MDSTSWSCTTAVTDAGSHDSDNQSPMCRLPMLYHQVCRINNLLVPESCVPETHSQPSSAAKAVPEAGEEKGSYQPGRYENLLGEVESRTMELLSYCHLLRSIARHVLQKGK